MAALVGRNAPREPGLAPEADLPPEYWQALLDDPRAESRSGPSGGALRLSQIPQHILRVGCRRCGRVVEIQKVDAVRLYGRRRSGRVSGGGSWTIPARSGPGATRKTAAGLSFE